MKKSNAYVIILVITLMMSWNIDFSVASQDVSSMTCDNGVVEIGDFFQSVQDKCGEPDKKERNFWRYNFGPSSPVYTIEIDQNGNVVRIVEDQWDS